MGLCSDRAALQAQSPESPMTARERPQANKIMIQVHRFRTSFVLSFKTPRRSDLLECLTILGERQRRWAAFYLGELGLTPFEIFFKC